MEYFIRRRKAHIWGFMQNRSLVKFPVSQMQANSTPLDLEKELQRVNLP